MKQFPEDLPGLVAFWDFRDDDFSGGFVARGPSRARLHEIGEPLERVNDGVFAPRSLRFSASGVLPRGYLVAPRGESPSLGIGGPDARVSVVAWIKREPSAYEQCEFVAGVWNEHGGRQYGMFLNLKIWDSGQQIGAHVSSHGGATPGFPYCMDAAIGATKIGFHAWHCVAISYDGMDARVYLDGVLDAREPQNEAGGNPFFYPGGLFYGKADFTVGAVARPERVVDDGKGGFVEQGSLVSNPFVGLLGGLAVFNRALTNHEIFDLAAQ